MLFLRLLREESNILPQVLCLSLDGGSTTIWIGLSSKEILRIYILHLFNFKRSHCVLCTLLFLKDTYKTVLNKDVCVCVPAHAHCAYVCVCVSERNLHLEPRVIIKNSKQPLCLLLVLFSLSHTHTDTHKHTYIYLVFRIALLLSSFYRWEN